MALRKTVLVSGFKYLVTDYGPISLGEDTKSINAYIKVSAISGSKDELCAKVLFSEGDISVEKSYAFSPNLDGKNFIHQAYVYLKTLPEFDGAEDC